MSLSPFLSSKNSAEEKRAHYVYPIVPLEQLFYKTWIFRFVKAKIGHEILIALDFSALKASPTLV